MSEFVLPVLGLGDHQPYTIVWKDGTVIYRGILGSAFEPEPEPEPDRHNVVYLCEYREKKKWQSDDHLPPAA